MNSRQPHRALKSINYKNRLEICSNMMCFVSYPQLCLFQSYNLFKFRPVTHSVLLQKMVLTDSRSKKHTSNFTYILNFTDYFKCVDHYKSVICHIREVSVHTGVACLSMYALPDFKVLQAPNPLYERFSSTTTNLTVKRRKRTEINKSVRSP
jgi:hypothetical protein